MHGHPNTRPPLRIDNLYEFVLTSNFQFKSYMYWSHVISVGRMADFGACGAGQGEAGVPRGPDCFHCPRSHREGIGPETFSILHPSPHWSSAFSHFGHFQRNERCVNVLEVEAWKVYLGRWKMSSSVFDEARTSANKNSMIWDLDRLNTKHTGSLPGLHGRHRTRWRALKGIEGLECSTPTLSGHKNWLSNALATSNEFSVAHKTPFYHTHWALFWRSHLCFSRFMTSVAPLPSRYLARSELIKTQPE